MALDGRARLLPDEGRNRNNKGTEGFALSVEFVEMFKRHREGPAPVTHLR